MILWMLAALVGYFVKGVAGIGNTLVVTSVMAYSRSNAEITPVELLLCVPTNLVVLWVNRRGINWRLTIAPLVMVLLGDILGVLLLKNVDVGVLKIIFGVVLILLSGEVRRDSPSCGDAGAGHPGGRAVRHVRCGSAGGSLFRPRHHG